MPWKTHRGPLLLAGLLAGSLACAPGAAGQRRAETEEARLRRRVVLLEDRVATLERQIAALEERRPEPPGGAAPAGWARAEGWRERESWRRLRRGIGAIEVHYLLGTPGRVVVGETGTLWHYPRGGTVRFDAPGERVQAWKEPG